MTVYHLAEPDAWEEAERTGHYTRSTRGRTLADEGFIHCSSATQWPVVRAAFYADVATDLVLLEIDEERLGSPLVREVGNPETGEEFPHVYGPIEVSAVVGTRRLPPPHTTRTAP